MTTKTKTPTILQDIQQAIEPKEYLWLLIAGIAILIGIVATSGNF